MRRSPVLAVLLALLFAGPLFADAEAIARALRDAARAASPAESFLGALADLPELECSGEDLRAALRRAGVPSHPASDAILGHVQRLRRRGDTITLLNDGPSATQVVVDGKPKGWITLQRVVSFRVRREGDAVALDGFAGLGLSKDRDSFQVSLKRVRVGPEDSRRVAKVTAGLVWPLVRTVTIDLKRPTSFDETPEPRAGLVDRVGR